MTEKEQIQQQIKELLEAFFSGRISVAEKQKLSKLSNSPAYTEALDQMLQENFYAGAADPISLEEARQFVDGMKEKMRAEKKTPVRRLLRFAAAAVIIFAIATTWLVLTRKQEPANNIVYTGNVAPGREGAKLKLSNGSIILTDSLQDGFIAMDGTMKVFKRNGKIVFEGTAGPAAFNEVITDKGRQTSVVLPDGSTAWLNAGSSLKFPLRFDDKERVVDMTGEVYFEVVHNAKQPFKVRTPRETIEDIGTSFNVNAYSDEAAMVTTLVEGAIKIADKILKPGQAYSNGVVKETDVDKAIAWHKGLFSFDHADLATMMRQLSRWYNVEIQYEGKIPAETFTGKMGRDLSLADALDALQQMHVRFRIEEDKRVVITP